MSYRIVTFLSFTALAVLLGSVLIGQHAVAQSVDANEAFELGDGANPTVPGIADIAGSALQPGPDWGDLFNADRTPKDAYDEFGNAGSNGVPDFLDTWGYHRSRRDAAFIADDVSASNGTDNSVFVASGVIGPGTVDAGFDLGNAYAYTGFANLRNLVLYAGVERLSTAEGSIVFEFNRKLFSVGSAGEILGQHSTGDLRVQASFPAGVLSSVAILKWDIVDAETGAHDWVLLETLPISPAQQAGQCNSTGTICTFCNEISVEGGAWPTYDDAGDPTTTLLPDTFMELGINLSALLGHNWRNFYTTRYSTVQISTYDTTGPAARDYALGTFARAGRLAPNPSQ